VHETTLLTIADRERASRTLKLNAIAPSGASGVSTTDGDGRAPFLLGEGSSGATSTCTHAAKIAKVKPGVVSAGNLTSGVSQEFAAKVSAPPRHWQRCRSRGAT